MFSNRRAKYAGIEDLIKAYQNGENVTRAHRDGLGLKHNDSESIEIAYDLQAGSYVQATLADMPRSLAYAGELADKLDTYIESGEIILDIGAGELTTLSLVVRQMRNQPRKILAFDISWSRLWRGLPFAQIEMDHQFKKLIPFVADIHNIPLLDKSVDIVTSSHALEPNGGQEKALLREIFRVTRKFAILFEPSYEVNSEAGQERMRDLGYIRGLVQAVEELGGVVVATSRIDNIANPLNPTVGYVIKPPGEQTKRISSTSAEIFASPINKRPLLNLGEIYLSRSEGVCYPVLKGIPILRSDAAILASALC